LHVAEGRWMTSAQAPNRVQSRHITRTVCVRERGGGRATWPSSCQPHSHTSQRAMPLSIGSRGPHVLATLTCRGPCLFGFYMRACLLVSSPLLRITSHCLHKPILVRAHAPSLFHFSNLAKAAATGDDGWDGSSAEPLGPPPGPLQYRLLSTVIADQLQAIARAEHKGLSKTFEGQGAAR